MFKKLRIFGLALVLILTIGLVAACGGGDNNENNSSDNNSSNNSNNEANDSGNEEAGGLELGETEITVPYVAWAGAMARTPLVELVLEEAGYDVDPKQVEAGPMWSSVADGSSDFMTASWLPATHQSYWEQYEADVEVVGEFVAAAPLALTVPAYMEDINSIEDLKGNEELGEAVEWEIVGIDPGAGIMQNTETVLEEYELENWELLQSSETAMLSELSTKIDDEEPIIVPLWKPHWAFAEMDLKMLEDPQGIYGGDGDRIEIIANKEFKDNSPAAYEILQRLAEDYNEDVENELLVAINEGNEAEAVAQEYLDNHPELLEKWLEGIN